MDKPQKPKGRTGRKPNQLNEKQAHFCREYLIDNNATQAAIRAGYKKETAGVVGCTLLKNLNVQDRIGSLIALRDKRLDIKADAILQELQRIGMSDVRELYKDDGTILHPKEWPEDLARAVASIEVEELFEHVGNEKVWIGYTKKVRFWPKTQALDLLGKHKRLFTDRVEIDVSDKLAEKIAAARARAAMQALPAPDDGDGEQE